MEKFKVKLKVCDFNTLTGKSVNTKTYIRTVTADSVSEAHMDVWMSVKQNMVIYSHITRIATNETFFYI